MLWCTRLTTDALYAEYLEYCRLFNVPVPAEKGQVGRYIKEKFGIASIVTTVDKVSARCYPGLWLSKSATLAYAELSLNYSNYTKTTDKLQKGEVKSGISSLLTTANTEEWPKKVIEEIGRMFDYIQSCQNPQDISYEGYLKNGVVSVVTVVSGQEIAIPEKSPVVLPSLPCSFDGDPVVTTIEADLQRAEEEQRKKEEHFREVAEKYTGANGGEGDSSLPARAENTKPIEEEPQQAGIGPHPLKDAPTPPTKEAPGFQKFKAGMKKHKHVCRLCGQHFEQPLVIAGYGGYICAKCHREGPPTPPQPADSQTKLGGEVEA